MKSIGLAIAHGTPQTRDKRTQAGTRRFTRHVGSSGFVLRPACGCDIHVVVHHGDPLICPDCGGARLTQGET